jgi:hypothetical protein
VSGQGKYTTYAPQATNRNSLLNKLFKGNSTISNPLQDLTGKEEDARAQTIARAKALLTPEVQQGDPGHFPNGVKMTYVGDDNGVQAPDLTKVKWEGAGDPANGYTPDISSPGPGFTDPLSKNVDPKITVTDVKGTGYVAGAPGTGTKSPTQTSATIKENATLGKQGKLDTDVNGFG